jgi:hypothetical protein
MRLKLEAPCELACAACQKVVIRLIGREGDESRRGVRLPRVVGYGVDLYAVVAAEFPAVTDRRRPGPLDSADVHERFGEWRAGRRLELGIGRFTERAEDLAAAWTVPAPRSGRSERWRTRRRDSLDAPRRFRRQQSRSPKRRRGRRTLSIFSFFCLPHLSEPPGSAAGRHRSATRST